MNKKIILFLLLLVAVAAATFVYSSMKANNQGGSVREIAAIVNGNQIYMDEVSREMATIPARQRQNFSELDVLDFLIEKRLLLDAASKEGIKVTQQDIDVLYRKYANPNYFDLRATEALLAEQNLTQEELVVRLTEQAAINKLLEKKADSIALAQKISGSEVQQIYNTSFRGQNVSFDDVESEILSFIIQKRKENLRTSYINSLKSAADIIVFVQP